MFKKGILLLITIFCLFLLSFKISNAQVLNELYTHPTDLDTDTYDWVEVYMDGVDKSLYQLQDSSGNVKNLSEATCYGNYCVVGWSNRLNDNGDTIKLVLSSSPNGVPVDQITYGGDGNICVPGQGQSIGRLSTLVDPFVPTNTWERFSPASKGLYNDNEKILPCPSLTPVPNTPTPTTPAPTNTPTSTPTPTNSPSSTPTSTPKPSVTPTKKPTPTPKDYTNENAELSADVSQFRYDSADEEKESVQEVLGAKDQTNENISPFAYVLLGLGIVFVGISVFLYIRNKKQ